VESLTIFAAFGLAYGIVLQRSGFCFARAGFEMFLLRSRDAFNGIMAGLVVATAGFTAVAAVRGALGLEPASHLLALPVGAGTLFGGILFGIGMTLAGMCAAGTLQRLGEGYVIAWFTLVGAIAGAALDPFSAFIPQRWVLQLPRGLWLGSGVGVIGGGMAGVAALLLIWRGVARFQDGGRQGKRRAPMMSFTPAVIGGALLGLINTVQAAVATPWTVSYPLALVPAAMSHALGATAMHRAAPYIALDLGLILGSLISSARDGVHVKAPRHFREVATALTGGVLMAWGVQLAKGCSIGGVFSAVPSLSIGGWLFFPSLFLGAWIGNQVIRRLH
jgi:hypothetical protein